jgi:hypothetical protein
MRRIDNKKKGKIICLLPDLVSPERAATLTNLLANLRGLEKWLL